MKFKEIILVGAGGHAISCIDVIEKTNSFKIKGLIEKKTTSKKIYNYPILGTDSDLKKLRKKYNYAFIAIGQIKNSSLRTNIFNKLISLSFSLPIIISPYSYFSDKSTIEEGSIIMHHSIVNAGVKIGKNCIINTKSLVEHDVIIGDHCHIATGTIINGNCNIGNGVFIGSGTILNNNITIGKHCVIAAGSVVKKSLPERSVFINK